MTTPKATHSLIAIDVGNSRIKLGRFDSVSADDLPLPTSELQVATHGWDPDEISRWLSAGAPIHMAGASVVDSAWNKLAAWLHGHFASHGTPCRLTKLRFDELPLEIALDQPGQVGIDRLVGAVAANQIRKAGNAAIVVDVGTAITVNLIRPDGAFAGGAILPGIEMSTRAMHQFTDRLPLIDQRELAGEPEALGRSTQHAMRSGLYWGAVGAMKELIGRLAERYDAPLQVFLTGGAAPAVASHLGDHARRIPHLKLAGIAIAAASVESQDS